MRSILFICVGVGILEFSVVLSVVSIVVIDRYTTDQRVVIVKVHYKYRESFAETVRKLHAIFGQDNAPNESSVQRLISKFKGTGSVLDLKRLVWTRAGCSLDNIEAVYVIV